MTSEPQDVMNLAREWMDIQRDYLMSSMRALTRDDGEADGLEGVYQRELETTRRAVEKTLALEERAVEEFRRGAADIPGMNGMVELMSEFSRDALRMRGELWQALFDQMHASSEAEQLAAKQKPTSADE